MATIEKNLSSYEAKKIPSASGFSFGIVVAEWNREITEALLKGTRNTLLKLGCKEESIEVVWVPGTFEITAAANWLVQTGRFDAIICLGCVIQGETPHFTYICQGVTQGITQLNVEFNIPFIFGVLTTHNKEQALDRCGGKHGNKGDEAAVCAVQMVNLRKEILK